MTKTPSTSDIPLMPFTDFKKEVRKILNVSKEESDKHITALQTSNAQQRIVEGQKKRGRKPQNKS